MTNTTTEIEHDAENASRSRPTESLDGQIVNCPTSPALADDGLPIIGCGSTDVDYDPEDSTYECRCGLVFSADEVRSDRAANQQVRSDPS
ncbi:MAG: hypothetical protein M3Y35_04015 [Actinomycetota bacterium]|nr:hypothetical protein [Actinomycetota bacterium]